MSQVMLAGILVLLYIVYLVTGLHFGFAVGWVDWNSPYLHYQVVSGGQDALPLFAAPALVMIWLAYLWYHKSMMGEA